MAREKLLRPAWQGRGTKAGKSKVDRGFICVIARLRYTPYHLIRKHEPRPRDLERAAISARHAERDLAKVREMIVRIVRSPPAKVLLCPEMTYQIDTAREFLFERLPEDVKSRVVLRDTFWLPDEACSVYARSLAVIAVDNRSPIFALTTGVPTMYIRQPTDTIKGRMWADVGLGDWFCEIGSRIPLKYEVRPPDLSELARARLPAPVITGCDAIRCSSVFPPGWCITSSPGAF